ncbi:hypothetical protein Bbelb_444210 [Branchiostoma belcheri]|nr:hypothetical protein Bbelb_444210 [Branchiostoma belcheri]
MAFGIPEEKKGKFGTLRRQILSEGKVDVKLLQKLVGKIISFAVAVPGTQLFTRECNLAISQAVRKGQMIYIRGDLRKEIEHWEFLESWQGSFPWRQERHLTIKLASDASNARWGGVIDPGMDSQLVLGDAWSQRERALHINIKEALAVDNQAVMHAWKAQGRKSKQMFDVLKEIFSLTLRMNCALSMSYVRSADNPADMPSRSFSEVDMALTEDAWETLELELGPHGIDCMAMPSNARLHNFIAPFPTRQARAVDFFAQTFGKELAKYGKGYVFPPVALVGQVLVADSEGHGEQAPLGRAQRTGGDSKDAFACGLVTSLSGMGPMGMGNSLVEEAQEEKDLVSATPKDVLRYLVWKDEKGKTKVHVNACPSLGSAQASDVSARVEWRLEQ